MSSGPARARRDPDAPPAPVGPMSVRLYVIVPVRVKEWLEEEGDRSGLAVSAVARQLLTRAYGEATRALG